MQPIPFVEWNPTAQNRIHFAHANGYPPQAYERFLEQLADSWRVTAMEARPLWPGRSPKEVKDWGDFVDDLVTYLDQHAGHADRPQPWVGVGHSLGGTVTLMAAIQRPDLFNSLVLIDPPFFLPHASLIWNIVFRLGLAYWMHPLVKGAVNRRNQFESVRAMFDHYRPKNVFKNMDDQGLWAYVKALANETGDGSIHLRYSPEWEARVYATGLLQDWKTWRGLKGLTIPVLLLRPEHHPTTSEETSNRLQAMLPQLTIQTIPDTTHLAPLEQPTLVARMIQKFLD